MDLQKLPPVLDACCGSRMFWFDRKDNRATFGALIYAATIYLEAVYNQDSDE